MKEIQPITIWSNGQQLTANFLSICITSDDLKSNATFYYELLTPSNMNEDGTVLGFNRIVQGYLYISDSEYDAWGQSMDVNEEVYIWTAQKLNLTLL